MSFRLQNLTAEKKEKKLQKENQLISCNLGTDGKAVGGVSKKKKKKTELIKISQFSFRDILRMLWNRKKHLIGREKCLFANRKVASWKFILFDRLNLLEKLFFWVFFFSATKCWTSKFIYNYNLLTFCVKSSTPLFFFDFCHFFKGSKLCQLFIIKLSENLVNFSSISTLFPPCRSLVTMFSSSHLVF